MQDTGSLVENTLKVAGVCCDILFLPKEAFPPRLGRHNLVCEVLAKTRSWTGESIHISG